MGKAQQLTQLLRRLNKHFGRAIHIGYGKFLFAPCSLPEENRIEMGADKRLYDIQILAHEYAHFLIPTDVFRHLPFSPYSFEYAEAIHPPEFWARYSEVCGVLSVPPFLRDRFCCNLYVGMLLGMTTKEIIKKAPREENLGVRLPIDF